MGSFSVLVEIPALDRLCALLEQQDRASICSAIEDEIVSKLKEAAQSGVPKPEFKVVPPSEEVKPEPVPEPESKPVIVTLDAVQKAAAQMRDAGKLAAVTGLFPEFGIGKLSDLEGDKLAEFATRLQQMGAKL